MSKVGPAIERLTRRLSETPGDFLENPIPTEGKKAVNVAAVVSDLLVDLGGAALAPTEARNVLGINQARQQTMTMIVCWLLHDEWFRDARCFADSVRRMITKKELEPLARIVEPRLFVTDPDRREELARTCLERLGLRPEGESETMARDRLTTLSTIERERVIRESREAQERMKRIQEEMRRKKAQEAAPAWGRE